MSDSSELVSFVIIGKLVQFGLPVNLLCRRVLMSDMGVLSEL